MTRGKHLGELEGLILLTVLRLKEEAYGAGIKKKLRARAGRAVSISTIYVTLMRLEEKGYVHSWKGEPSASRGGKAKRFYEVRPAGVQALEGTRAVRDRMWEGVEARAR